jgi:nucleoside-diphosphate-sugar epimerase
LDAFERKHGRLVRLEASGGVVLATGGFVLNGAMMERHAPRLAKALPLGTAGDDGSGISMAAEIGAAVDRMDRCAAWRFFYPPKAFLSGVLVNLLGQRFCDESSYGATVGRLISEQPSGRAFLVIDAEVVRRVASEAGRDERLVDRSLKDLLSGRANDLIFRKLTTWLNVNVNRYRRPALEEIERACSMPAGSLVSTITEHNRRLEANEPDAFGKGDEMRRPIAEPPFLAIPCELENKLFLGPCFTLGGLKTDPSSGRALRPDGTVIPGLFAAGRCAVGVSTGGYVSGLSIADCVFSGRNAGRSAASRAGSGEGEAPAGAGSVTTTASGGESSLDSDGPSILITGGGGFLGRALTARLFDQDRLQGDEGRPLRPKRVRVLDRRLAPTEWPGPVEVTPGDICDPDTVRRAVRDMDLVVHAAALVDWGQLPPERVFEVNLEATHRLIEACRESTVRGLVHISSLDAVWRGESMRDVDESWPYPDRFDTPYCESKALSEEAVLEASSDGLRTVVIRPCSIWGESDPYHLQPLVDASRLGVLPRVGNGVMQWVYVGNVAHAITLAGRATLDASPEACGQVYFATDFPARTFCDQMEPMLTAAGIRVTRWSMPRLPLAAAATVMWRACRLLRPVFDIQPVLTPFAVAQLYGDFTVSTDKAERLLGYRPLYSEEAAYERTIRALGLDLEANRR